MSIFDKDIIQNDEDIKLKKLLEDIEKSKNIFFQNFGASETISIPTEKLFYLELNI